MDTDWSLVSRLLLLPLVRIACTTQSVCCTLRLSLFWGETLSQPPLKDSECVRKKTNIFRTHYNFLSHSTRWLAQKSLPSKTRKQTLKCYIQTELCLISDPCQTSPHGTSYPEEHVSINMYLTLIHTSTMVTIAR